MSIISNNTISIQDNTNPIRERRAGMNNIHNLGIITNLKAGYPRYPPRRFNKLFQSESFVIV